MKKRNVAVAMAAVTVAGTVAPVVANAAGKETNLTVSQYAAFENQLKGYINTRYSDVNLDGTSGTNGNGNLKDKSVYSIVAKGVDSTGSKITGNSSDEFKISETSDSAGTTKEAALANLKKVSELISKSTRGQVVTFEVQDLGHKVDKDGKIVNTGDVKLKLSDVINNSNLDKTNTENAMAVTKDYLALNNVTKKGEISSGKVSNITDLDDSTNHPKDVFSRYLTSVTANTDGSVKLVFNTPTSGYVLVNSDEKTPVVANNLTITLKPGDAKIDLTQPEIKNNVITGFKKLQGVIGKSEVNTTVISNSTTETVNVSKNDIEAKAKDLQDRYGFSNLATAKDEIKEVNGVFEVTLFANTIRVTRSIAPSGTLAQITLRANTKADLVKLIDLLNGQLGDVTSVIGINRVDTAIKLSKENYNKNGFSAVDNIVLVGEHAIVDGLSAAPLAAKKKAPLLLTNSKTLNAEVKEEIKRAMNLDAGITASNPKTVYIVGGETVVSKEIELELSKMGLTIKRLAGSNRSTTSLEVAKEVGITNKAFVVGGNGLADAMSIAPVAAREKSPIIVVDQAKLSDEAKTTLRSFGTADIIGGETVVSKEVEKEIDSSVLGTSTRVEGNNRKETNAAVITKYYKDSKSDMFYVAKDGTNADSNKVNSELVDALAVAPIAGNQGAPIVLATNEVNTKQAISINGAKKSTTGNKLVQVGGGIADAVMKQVKELLGL